MTRDTEETILTLLVGVPLAVTLFLVFEAWVWPSFTADLCQTLLRCR